MIFKLFPNRDQKNFQETDFELPNLSPDPRDPLVSKHSSTATRVTVQETGQVESEKFPRNSPCGRWMVLIKRQASPTR